MSRFVANNEQLNKLVDAYAEHQEAERVYIEESTRLGKAKRESYERYKDATSQIRFSEASPGPWFIRHINRNWVVTNHGQYIDGKAIMAITDSDRGLDTDDTPDPEIGNESD